MNLICPSDLFAPSVMYDQINSVDELNRMCQDHVYKDIAQCFQVCELCSVVRPRWLVGPSMNSSSMRRNCCCAGLDCAGGLTRSLAFTAVLPCCFQTVNWLLEYFAAYVDTPMIKKLFQAVQGNKVRQTGCYTGCCWTDIG